MILTIVDQTGDTSVDVMADYDLAADLFRKAVEQGMWAKGIAGKKSYFLPARSFSLQDVLHKFDEIIMLPQLVGG